MKCVYLKLDGLTYPPDRTGLYAVPAGWFTKERRLVWERLGGTVESTGDGVPVDLVGFLSSCPELSEVINQNNLTPSTHVEEVEPNISSPEEILINLIYRKKGGY